MTLDEIKQAVLAGKTVNWDNQGYRVIVCQEMWYIEHIRSGDVIGLTHLDGVTLNGEPEEFFLKGCY